MIEVSAVRCNAAVEGCRPPAPAAPVLWQQRLSWSFDFPGLDPDRLKESATPRERTQES